MTDKPVNCRCGGNARLEMPDDDSGITNIFCEKCYVALDSFAHDWSSEQLVDPTADIIAGAEAMRTNLVGGIRAAVQSYKGDPNDYSPATVLHCLEMDAEKIDPTTIARQVMEKRK